MPSIPKCRWSCLNCGFTTRDILFLVAPSIWTIAAIIFFCYYTVHPLLHNQFPKTIPLYWSFISAYPSFMTALHIFLFRLESIEEKGMSRNSSIEVLQAVRLLSLGGIGFFIVMATTSAVQLAQCRMCEQASYGESIAWFVIASVWIILMAATAPKPSLINQLIYKYDTNFQQPNYSREGPYITSEFVGEPCAYDWYGAPLGDVDANLQHGNTNRTARVVNMAYPAQGGDFLDVVQGKVKDPEQAIAK